MRFAGLVFAALLAGGCSLFLDDGDGGGDDGGDGDGDGDIAPGACERGSCPVLMIERTIGAAHDFSTAAEWASLRGGNLVERVVVALANSPVDELTGGQLVIPDCLVGSVVPGSKREGNFLYASLDDVTDLGECAIGVEIEAGATFAGFVGEGAIERGLVQNLEVEGAIEIAGVTSNQAYFWLTAADDAHHFGVSGSGARLRSEAAGTPLITVRAPHTRIDRLELLGWRGTQLSDAGILVEASDVVIEHMLISDDDGGLGEAPGIRVRQSSVNQNTPSATVANTAIHSTTGACIVVGDDDSMLRVVNSTLFGCWQSTNVTPDAAVVIDTGQPAVEIINVIAVASGAAAFGPGVSGPVGTHCFHDDPATDLAFSQQTTVPDLAFLGAPTNLGISVGSVAVGAGVAQPAFAESINGEVRNDANWSSGAYTP